MTDILMQNNRLSMFNGDFLAVNGIEEIKQQIIVALNTFYGDWLNDYRKGIDYAYGLRREEFLEHDIKKQISGIKGVKSIKKLIMKFDKDTHSLKVTAGITTVYGSIDFENLIRLAE